MYNVPLEVVAFQYFSGFITNKRGRPTLADYTITARGRCHYIVLHKIENVSKHYILTTTNDN